MSQTLGQPIIVENKAGAAGAIGAVTVAQAPADGYTALVGPSSAIVINPHVSQISYDVARDFRPVGLVMKAETLIVAHPSKGFNSLADVIGYARANPGKLTFGSFGPGSSAHLVMAHMQSVADIELLHVPYKGAAPAELALVAGEIDLLVVNTVSSLPHIEAGKMTPIALISSAQSQTFPKLAKAADFFPNFIFDTWVALYVPAKTSEAIVDDSTQQWSKRSGSRSLWKTCVARALSRRRGRRRILWRFRHLKASAGRMQPHRRKRGAGSNERMWPPIVRSHLDDGIGEMTEPDRSTQSSPLRGLKVIELGTMIAGPVGCTLLGDFGADIIKIEQPKTGDTLRQLGPFVDGESLFWNVDGRNKRSVAIDLHHREGQDLVRRLVAQADAVVENFRPGTLAKWGLSFADLIKINPRLVMVSVSGFGQTGPYSSRAAYDRTALAFGGLLHVTGYPDRPPVRPGLPVADYTTALFCAFSLVMALYERDVRGGQGKHVDVALYESMFRFSEAVLAAYDRLGEVRQRQGNIHPAASPAEHFETSDGRFLVLAVGNTAMFSALLR